jgi:hypothetical protein
MCLVTWCEVATHHGTKHNTPLLGLRGLFYGDLYLYVVPASALLTASESQRTKHSLLRAGKADVQETRLPVWYAGQIR